MRNNRTGVGKAGGVLLLLLSAQPASTQGSDIIVTGAGLPAGVGDAAYDVVTIDRQRLTGSASGRLADILQDTAGFQQFRRSDPRSAHPTSQGATLRGLGGNASSRALILLDGVPQIDPFGGWVSWAAYEPMRLGLVRVARRRLARRRLSLLFGELVAQEMFGHLSGGQTG
jgi:vitamin B12 transporter